MLNVDAKKVLELDSTLEHIRPTVGWRVPEVKYERIPLIKSYWFLAWEVISLHLNAAASMLDAIENDPANVVSDASTMWFPRINNMFTEARTVHDAFFSKYGRQELAPWVKNAYGIQLELHELGRFALEYIVEPLQDKTKSRTDRLRIASGASIVFILLCYRNIFNHRDIDQGVFTEERRWGDAVVMINRRARLAALDILPDAEVGYVGRMQDALREEFLHQVISRTADADIGPEEDGSLYSKLRSEFMNIVKRRSMTKGVPASQAIHSNVDPKALLDSFMALMKDTAVKTKLLVSPQLSNQWRSIRSGELNGIVHWFLQYELNTDVAGRVQRKLELHYHDVPRRQLDDLTVNGYRDFLESLKNYHSFSGDRERFYSDLLARVDEVRPGKVETVKLEHISEFKLDELRKSVFWPHITMTKDRKETDANGVVTTQTEEKTLSLGQPRLCISDRRMKLKSLEGEALFLSPVSFEKDGRITSVMPMQLINVKEVDHGLPAITDTVTGLVKDWNESIREVALDTFSKTGTLVGNYGGKKIDWEAKLRNSVEAALRTSEQRLLLQSVPLTVWASLGIFVDQDLNIRTFGRLATDKNTLKRTTSTKNGYMYLKDVDENVKPEDIIALLDKEDESVFFSTVTDKGVFPTDLLSGDEVVTPWEAIVTDDEFMKSWFVQLRQKTMGSGRKALPMDLETVGEDLLLLFEAREMHPDVPTLRRSNEVAPLTFLNGRYSYHQSRLLEYLFDETLLGFMKKDVRNAAKGLITKLLDKWGSSISKFDPTVVGAASAFVKGPESAAWFRTVMDYPDTVDNLRYMVVALAFAELAGDMAALSYLSARGKLDVLQNKRVEVTPMIWGAKDDSKRKWADIVSEKKAKELFNKDTPLSLLADRLETFIDFGLNKKKAEEFKEYLNGFMH